MKKLLTFLLALVMIVNIFGNSVETVSAKTKTSPSLSRTKLTLEVGETKTLKIKGWKSNHYYFSDWYAKNMTIVGFNTETFSETCEVTGLIPGKTTIIVELEGVKKKLKCTVKVNEPKDQNKAIKIAKLKLKARDGFKRKDGAKPKYMTIWYWPQCPDVYFTEYYFKTKDGETIPAEDYSNRPYRKKDGNYYGGGYDMTNEEVSLAFRMMLNRKEAYIGKNKDGQYYISTNKA